MRLAGKPARDAVSEEDLLLEEAADYWWYAERFGWTPDVVDELPQWLAARLHTVAAVNDEVVQERNKG